MSDSYLAQSPRAAQLDIIADTALGARMLASAPKDSALSTITARAKDSALSTAAKKAKDSALSTVAAVDRRRKDAGISHERLCREAGIQSRNWFRLLRREHEPKPATLRKLAAALDALAAGANVAQRRSLCQAYLRTITVQMAVKTGWDPELMLSQNFDSENTNDPVWLQASRLRRCAVYLLVEGLALGKANIGRAIGVSRQAVHKSVAAIEAERERDAAFDDVMASMMLQVKGERL